MRDALVHYWLTNMRGGERVLETFCEMFPQADIYTHVVDRSKLSDTLNRHEIKTTFVSNLPFAKSQYQKYLPFMPRALEERDLAGYDLVISSESGPAKGVITSAARVDQFIANSNFVARRIRKFYRRDSEVVFPPVAVSEFAQARQAGPGEYYLAAGEMVGYKRFDLVVDAFTKLGAPLVVVGEGAQMKSLQQRAGPNVKFVGRVKFSELKQRFGACKALVFPGEEDFGMIPVEVMAAGRPVIAYGKGGALDTVVDGKTGILFGEQTVDSLIDAVSRFEAVEFDADQIHAHARGFDADQIKSKVKAILEQNGLEL